MDSKRPVTTSGRPASSTDSRTWSDFKTASESSAGVGLGFVLGEEGPGRKIRDGRNIERYTAGRYIAVTGRAFKL